MMLQHTPKLWASIPIARDKRHVAFETLPICTASIVPCGPVHTRWQETVVNKKLQQAVRQAIIAPLHQTTSALEPKQE